MNHALTTASTASDTIANHHARQRWEDGDAGYMLGMLLADLLVFARVRGIDFDSELATARETLADVYEEADLAPAFVDLPMPAPSDLPAAALDMSYQVQEALGVHIYSLEDGDVIPADCPYLLSIQRVRAALGLPPADIATGPAEAA